MKKDLVRTISGAMEKKFSKKDPIVTVEKDLKSSTRDGHAPTGEFYRAFFHLVDEVNEYTGREEEGHRHQHWQRRMLFIIMKLAVFNVWVFGVTDDYVQFHDFRTNLARWILKEPK